MRQYLDEHRNQLWAEAKHRYEKGEKSYLGGEYESSQDNINAEYTRANEPMERIAVRLTHEHANGPPVHLSKLLLDGNLATDLPEAATKMPSTGKKLTGALRRLDWERGKASD